MRYKTGHTRIRIQVLILCCVFVCGRGPYALAAIEDEELKSLSLKLQSADVIESLAVIDQIERSGVAFEDMQELLAPALDSDDIRVVSQAVYSLFKNGDTESAAFLYRFLDESYPIAVRVRAVNVLMALDDLALREQLLARVLSEEQRVAVAILAAATAHDPSLIGAEHIEYLQSVFRDASSPIKLMILQITQELGTQAVPLVELALTDPDPIVQQEAFLSATRSESEQIKQIMRPLTQNGDKTIVYNAAFVLGMLGEPGYFRFIKRDLTADDRQLQQGALRFLKSKIGFGSEDYFIDTIRRLAEYASDETLQTAAKEYLALHDQIVKREAL